MKNYLSLFMLFVLTISAFSQSPEKMSYQAVIRNSSNQLVTNQAIRIRISILLGLPSGSVVYSETQTPSTNDNGLVTIEFGGGSDFTDIDWANGPYFLKTETDPTGGINYSIIGTSQLLSVPYAMYAKKAGNVFSGKYPDGNIYKTVKIGNQVWMAENLKTATYRNGDFIKVDTSSFLDPTEGWSLQWAYDNNENNVNTNGRL